MVRSLRVVELGRRRLELAEHVVPQVDRVREILEAHRVLGEARHRERARHGAEREDEVLVGELERAGAGRLHRDDAALLVERPDVPEQELCVRAHLP